MAAVLAPEAPVAVTPLRPSDKLSVIRFDLTGGHAVTRAEALTRVSPAAVSESSSPPSAPPLPAITA